MWFWGDFVVKKLWWENASDIDRSTDNMIKDFKLWRKQAIVVSAMRSNEFNTTDKLIEIWKRLWKWDFLWVVDIFDEIKDFHAHLMKTIFSWNDIISSSVLWKCTEIFEFYRKKLDKFIKYYDISNVVLHPSSDNDYSFYVWDDRYSMIWIGEIISSKLISFVLNFKLQNLKIGSWVISHELDLNRVICFDDVDEMNDRMVFRILSDNLAVLVIDSVNNGIIPVLPWFVWTFPEWIEKAIWRWYTDATAAALATGLSNLWNYDEVILEIQKSVKWMLSTDPRKLNDPDSAKLIQNIDYLTALEIIWSRGAQAKLLHHQSLREQVQEAWVRIHLFDPFKSELGTWISIDWDENAIWVQYVWWRDHINVVSISSWKMGKWFLARVSKIIAKYVSVDIISTTETEITFTFDWKNWFHNDMINAMMDDIKVDTWLWDVGIHPLEFIELVTDRALIFCVWQNMKDKVGVLAKATNALKNENVNIEFVSQGRLQRAMVFWIQSKDLNKALNALHNIFIWI